MTVIVPVQSAADVARHYDIDPRAFRRWIRRNQNVRLLGSLDSPAMHSTVARFRLMGSMSDLAVRGAHYAAQFNGLLDQPSGQWPRWVFAVENEYRGRGLGKEQS